MYFFKVEISSFEDAKQSFYIIPDVQAADETGPAFDEKQLTSHQIYRQFVKEQKTDVVDVSYVLYKSAEPITEVLTDELVAQLDGAGQLEKAESNEFSIASGFKSSKGGKSGGNLPMFLIIGGAALFIIVLIIIGAATSGGGDDTSGTEETTTETSDTAETYDTTQSAEINIQSTADATVEDGYIDVPESSDTHTTVDSRETAEATTAEAATYTESSSGGGTSGQYSVYFNANGGTGELESLSVSAGQYVVLPSAEKASESLSKKGYRLIGFTDTTSLEYPLYDYKMPYSNVTLYAVWEAAEYTVTYNSNGGVGTLSQAKVKYGEEVPMPTDIAVSKKDYQLVGWNTKQDAKAALKSLSMPYEDTTLYAVWNEEAKTADVRFHYDDNIYVQTEKIGTALDMRQDFGITKDGYIVSGWRFDGSPTDIDYLSITGDCDVYAQWERAAYITISIDRSYLKKDAETYKLPLDMNGRAKFTMPQINDRSDIYNSVYGCTYGYSAKKSDGQYGTIEYFGNTEYTFKKNTTLYRVLNKYGGGNGTKSNPYIIDYYDQLLFLAENNAKGYFLQTADIKFPNNTKRSAISTPRISQGYESKYYDFFVYDGQGYTIKNLNGSTGLFGTLAASTVKNVIIDGASLTFTGYANYGVLCNEVVSYSFKSDNGAKDFTTGNTLITGCTVKNSKIGVENTVKNLGGICGYGGDISKCISQSVSVTSYGTTQAVGGIVGNADSVKGCLANNITVEGGLISAGGICGTAYGVTLSDSSSGARSTGGKIAGCGVHTFLSSGATYTGGIAGLTSAVATDGSIRSCYAANIILNGDYCGGISGGDGGKSFPHRFSYCLIDNTNDYPIIADYNVRSKIGSVVLTVPADTGITVDGVLAVLNASGSGYVGWQRNTSENGGYPYP